MPGRPYHRCAHTGCPNRTRSAYCDRHQKHTRTDNFYGSRAWKRARAGYRRSVGDTCERCGAPAELVHHRDPHGPDLDPANLEALCSPCHNRAHPDRSPGVRR